MVVITFSEAVKLKKYIWEHYKTNLHIHDTCGGGLYFSIDKPNAELTEFIVSYFEARGLKAQVSGDGLTIYFDDSYTEKKAALRTVYEKDRQRSAAYDQDLLIGECTYRISNGAWIINHTYVKSTYRNQSIARQLVLLVLEEARKAKVRVIPECSYAKKVMSEEG